jgi:hypothetical protein
MFDKGNESHMPSRSLLNDQNCDDAFDLEGSLSVSDRRGLLSVGHMLVIRYDMPACLCQARCFVSRLDIAPLTSGSLKACVRIVIFEHKWTHSLMKVQGPTHCVVVVLMAS